MLLSKEIAQDVIAYAIDQGADFCELFVEKTSIQNIIFNSQKIKDITSGIDSGIGVRLLFGELALYAYSNSNKREDLLDMVKKLSAQFKSTQNRKQGILNFTPLSYQIIKMIPHKDVTLPEKIEALKKLDLLTRKQSPLLSQVSLSLMQKQQEIEIFNSDGLFAQETRPYIRLFAEAVAKDGTEQANGYIAPGVRGGFQFIENLNIQEVAETISKQALTVLKAKPCPAGIMPVVIENGFGGVIFHEACGHLLETTSVEKKSSILWDKKGEMIAHESVSAVDDGTNDNLWGSLSIDDEGMPTQKTQLIKNGKLENFICDKLGNIKTGHARTGSGRRQNYRYAPASRMRNTYIDNGQSNLDEMLRSIDNGLYCKAMGGGSVNPGTGEFNFSVNEGYLIKNGKIDHAIKGATLIGKGAEILTKISMVGNNLDYSAGMCGSVSGSIPTTVGQPALKVDDILVGGQV
ncbi:MAG: TldD/PmbA family protein [Bacteriovoracaceae bacterium]|nr:TldD/PmbA family protein [Bacteriovoracaceae bacterium]